MRCFDQCLAKNKCSKAAVFLLLVVLEVVNCRTFLIGRDWRRLPILIKLSRENRPETPLHCSLLSGNTAVLRVSAGNPISALSSALSQLYVVLSSEFFPCLYSANTWGALNGTYIYLCISWLPFVLSCFFQLIHYLLRTYRVSALGHAVLNQPHRASLCPQRARE